VLRFARSDIWNMNDEQLLERITLNPQVVAA
jgi:hypothetical protein